MGNNIIFELQEALNIELEAIQVLKSSFDENYARAVEMISNSHGKVIIMGVGKSGHIGKKIAATLASTGTPSFFVHSTEALHGDLGMIEEDDITILISNSGETGEVLKTIPSIRKIGAKIISITKNPESTLAKNSDIPLTYTYEKEADHLNLAPTTSSTLCLIIGDCLATVISKNKEFKKEDFHKYHPGGSLGKQLSK